MFNLKKSIIPSPVTVIDNEKKVKIGEVANADFSLKLHGGGTIFDEAVKYLYKTFEEKMFTVTPEGKFELCLKIDADNKEIKDVPTYVKSIEVRRLFYGRCRAVRENKGHRGE